MVSWGKTQGDLKNKLVIFFILTDKETIIFLHKIAYNLVSPLKKLLTSDN